MIRSCKAYRYCYFCNDQAAMIIKSFMNYLLCVSTSSYKADNYFDFCNDKATMINRTLINHISCISGVPTTISPTTLTSTQGTMTCLAVIRCI